MAAEGHSWGSPGIDEPLTDGRSGYLDPDFQQRQRDGIAETLERLKEAKAELSRSADIGTADTTRLDFLLEDVARRQADLLHEQEDARLRGAGLSKNLNTELTGRLRTGLTGRLGDEVDDAHDRELHYERAVQSLEQAVLMLRDNLDYPNGVVASTSSMATVTDEEWGGGAMEPVNAYMRRCKVLSTTDIAEEDRSFMPYARAVQIDALGLLLFVVYLLALLFYIYIRVTESIAPLGGLVWYGIIVFAIEMLGAISIIFYGIWLIAKPDNTDIAAMDLARGKGLRRTYTIRVLVPCYKESLPIVRRTILSARAAKCPPGCRVIIYLCDDGKDAKKRRFVESLSTTSGCDVVYVTGRPRKAGKMLNGKSENLNHCLKLIYPEALAEDGLPNIPIGELMCLFDADQTCSQSFFVNLIKYIDSGDDVAVALSPQLMHNVDKDSDIFNHQNVHFWEKMQPGMDALSFISLTGTNMIIRSRALQDCGWFPVDSVTEDWELGMRMKKVGWKCRYVQSYNAIGEAPEEVRQAFQQRSRWCKGHFQTFWSRQCPLVDFRLGLFYQLTYSSTCISYISAAVAVPVMTLMPIVTLCFGYFPIALNLWTVIAITVYYLALHALTFYVKSTKEFRALWLSNVATTILFWPYLKASILTPMKQVFGRGGATFKATAKGGGKASSATLKEIGPSILLTLGCLIAFIAGLSDFNANVNAPKAIALCWVVYNSIPHLLLLIYARFGPGRVLKGACKVFMVVHSLAALIALVCLWLLYPRDEDYVRAADLSLRFLEAQRSGTIDQARFSVPWRFTSGTQAVYNIPFAAGSGPLGGVVPPDNVRVDLSGGFYNDGEIGPVKVTSHVALTTSMLAWSLLDYQEWWRKDPARLTVALDAVSHGLRYVDSCYVPTTVPVNGVLTPNNDVLVYQVGSIETERTRWRRPEDISSTQPIGTVRLGDGASDLAGQMSAAMVAGSLALSAYGIADAAAAGVTIDRAHRLFEASLFEPEVYAEAANITLLALNDHYPTNSFADDLFWASTWFLRASQAGFRDFNKTYYYTAMRVTFELSYGERDSMAVTPDYMNNAAVVHAASVTRDWSFHSAAQSFFWDWICSGDVKYTTFGRSFHPEAPAMGHSAMAAALAAVYVHNAEKWQLAAKNDDFLRGFHCFAEGQGRTILGTTFRKPLMIGFNSRSYSRTWHRGASCPTYPSPCDISASNSDRSDINPVNGALIWLPRKADSCDDRRGANDTVISLENNVAVPLLFAGLASTAEREPYMRCLQGMGSLMQHPVCKHSRPLSTRLGPDNVPFDRMGKFIGLWTQRDTQAAAIAQQPQTAFAEEDEELSLADLETPIGGINGDTGLTGAVPQV